MATNEKSAVAKKEAIESGDENPERGNWSGKLDFILSCIGYAVGLGNVWRFPYLCFKHGGGAFLVPYAIMLVIIGIPCFLLELTFGQYSGMGPVVAYSNLAPIFKGLGLSNFLASCFVGLYYNVIIAWTIYYLFASFTSQLPWDSCGGDFNSEFCFNINAFQNCTNWRNETRNENIIFHNGSCLYREEDLAKVRANLSYFYGCTRKVPIFSDGKITGHSEQPGMYINELECVDPSEATISQLFDIPRGLRVAATEEYLNGVVLKKSGGIDDMGGIEWHMALCLLGAWLIIFFCLSKGIKSSGKVVYFTATFPYAMLVILLIRAVTLPGAYEGIKFYMVPEWSKLTDIKVWEGAAIQIFFSLSVAGGGLITLASYNKFHNNVMRDTFIVCIGNCCTSIFAGFVIFSVLGFLAHENGVEVKDVVKGGTGLAFVAYPDLVTRLPLSPLWSVLFFAMLLTLGLDSEFAIMETVITGITDYAPQLRSKHIFVVGGVCTVCFICGLPFATGGGVYLLDLLDYYAAGWPYLFIGLAELIMISHVYGFQNYLNDLYHIMKFKPGKWLKSHLMVLHTTVAPLLIGVILIISWASHEDLESGGYKYPGWANAVGMAIALIIIFAAIGIGLATFIHAFFVKHADVQGFSERLRRTRDSLLRPTPEWRHNAERAIDRDGGSSTMEGVVNLGMKSDDNTFL